MKKAYTLIEIIIVISILMILVGLSALSMVSFSKSAEVGSGRAMVEQAIREAQSNSWSNLGNLAWGVHFDNNRAVVFADSGSGYSPNDSNNRVKILPAGISLNTTFSNGNLFFNQGQTTLVSAGSVTVSGKGNPIQININSEGMIDY